MKARIEEAAQEYNNPIAFQVFDSELDISFCKQGFKDGAEWLHAQYRNLSPETVHKMYLILKSMERYQETVATLASKSQDRQLKENVYGVLLEYRQFIKKVEEEIK